MTIRKRILFYTNNKDEKDHLLETYGVNKISEALYLQDNNLSLNDFLCIYGKNKKFKNYDSGYGYCARNCKCFVDDQSKSNIEKYGSEKAKTILSNRKNTNENKSEEEKQLMKQKNSLSVSLAYKNNHKDIIKKRIATNRSKYGVDHVSQNEAVKEKYKQTSIEKYGVGHFFKTEEYKKMYKDIFLEKYGVDNPNKLESVQQKRESTNIEKYGVPFVIQNNEYKDKIHSKAKETFLEKYGVDHPWKSKEVRQTYMNTMFERYNVSHPSLRHLPEEYVNLDYQKLYDFINTNGCSIMDIQKYLGCCRAKVYRILNDYNLMPESRNLVETSLYIHLSKMNINIERNTRKIIPPQELDIYIPDKNIAIELNGVYWHSELNGRDKNYHLSKTIKCNNQNIHLLHFWDNEWVNHQEKCSSIIINFLGNSVKIPARKTVIGEVSKKEVRKFLDVNHLQNYQSSMVNLGLYHNDELVSVMTFSKSRYNKKYEWELIRFCNKLKHNVIGGAQKLFSYFIKNYNPTSIITYSERRLFTGKVYEKLGFKFLHFSSPNYLYTNNYQDFYSRIKFQKHKLSTLLENFNPDLTEWENMRLNGWDRIWDCGNSVWEWNK